MLLLLAALLQDPKFEVFDVKVHGRRMDTILYDLNGDGKLDLLNTSIDYDVKPLEVRWISIHYRDANNKLPGEASQIFPLDDRAVALVFGDVVPGGGIELGFIATDGVYVYPPSKKGLSETPVKLLHLRTFFTTVSLRGVPIWSFANDYDGNGMHDLLIPAHSGYRIFFQTERGRFGKTVDLESDFPSVAERVLRVERGATKPETHIGHFIGGRTLPHLGASDIDGDGLVDFYSLRRDLMTYFFHKSPGNLPSHPRSKGRVQYPIATLRQDPKKDAVDVAMILLIDLNQDRIPDLVVTRVTGQLGLLESLETRVFIHIGTGRGNFTSLKSIKVAGVSIDPGFIDMNGDGSLDCIVSRLRTDLLSQGSQLVLMGDIPITYEIFQFDKGKDEFLADPVWDQKVMVNKDDLQKKGAATVPLLFLSGDFTGDGRPDILFLEPKNEEVQLMRGRVHRNDGKDVIGFEPSPYFRKKLPGGHPKAVYVGDMNGDGVADALFFHAGAVGIMESRR